MKLLVTGGAGFIGSAVVRAAVNKGFDVINLDTLTYASCLENLNEISENRNYSFVKADIRNRVELDEVLERYKPEAIMHLAAESHVDRSIDGPGEFINTNIIGTYNLLEATRKYIRDSNVLKKFRFHHVSTDEVFGSLGPEGRFTEQSSYQPTNPYSASKASSDHLVRAWYETFDVPVVITNCANNYGPFQFPEKLIPVVILNAITKKPIPVYGQGQNIRDWLYVEDHADALLTVLERGASGNTYNIGGENEIRNIDLVRLICDRLDQIKPASFPYSDLIKFVEDRPGHDSRYSIDPSFIKKELDWSVSMNLEEGLDKTIRWYLENESWWRALQSRSGVGTRLGRRT